MELLKRFWNEEDGFGTVELVILIGVLVAVALIFRKAIISFVQKLIGTQMDESVVPGPTQT